MSYNGKNETILKGRYMIGFFYFSWEKILNMFSTGGYYYIHGKVWQSPKGKRVLTH